MPIMNRLMALVTSIGTVTDFRSHKLKIITMICQTVKLYCIVSMHLCSVSCSARQSEALPVRETRREESRLERTKRGVAVTVIFGGGESFVGGLGCGGLILVVIWVVVEKIWCWSWW